MDFLGSVFVIIGIIIGAGFASGKEIYNFFFVHGFFGIIGMVISTILIGVVIYKTLKIIKKYPINHYDDFLDLIIKNYNTKKIDIKLILNFIVNIFLLISFFIMCAGFSAYFKQEFGINQVISSIFMAIFCYLVLRKNIKGILILNSILIPTIIFILIILGIKASSNAQVLINTKNNYLWIFDAILYASYNTITLISILIPIKKYIKSKKEIAIISFLCTLIIMLLAGIIFIILLSIKENIGKIELPTVYATRNFGLIYKYLYGIIILGAIVTTAISSAYGFLNNVAKTNKKYKLYNLIICILSIFVSYFGFSNLVSAFYPIFGALGIIQLIFILKTY